MGWTIYELESPDSPAVIDRRYNAKLLQAVFANGHHGGN